MEISEPTLIVAVLGSSVITALIQWRRYRPTDAAGAQKTIAEAYAAQHTTDTTAFSLSSAELKAWIQIGSEAQKKIIDLERDLSRCTCGRGSNGK